MEACSVRGTTGTGNVNDPAEDSLSCFYLAASSLDRKRSEVVIYSVARSVPAAMLRIDTHSG